MKNFRAYTLSLNFYRSIQSVQLSAPLADQLERAATGICLTLAEGSGKRTRADQNRYFYMALGSAREIQCIFDMKGGAFTQVQHDMIDHLAASIYKLTRWGP
jgi:four helix bundle protein